MAPWGEQYMGEEIFLLSLEEFAQVPENIELVNIFGQLKLRQDANDDDRHGFTAYGLTETLAKRQGFERQFLLWLAKGGPNVH